MKGTIYMPEEINDVKKNIANTLKKYTYKVIKKNDIEDIIYVDTFSNKHIIDPTCNGLQCDDEILHDTIVLLKKIICLGAIDKKVQAKEFKKDKSTLLKAFVYLQLKHKEVKITSLDEAISYAKQKNIEIIPPKISKENIVNTLYNMIKEKNAKNNKTSIELKVASAKNGGYKKNIFIEITNFILTDKFSPYINLSKEKKEKFEIVLANSTSLNVREKIDILEKLNTLSLFQIEKLIEIQLDSIYVKGIVSKKKQIETAKTWNYLKENIDTFIFIKSHDTVFKLLSEFIIGQKEALKKISIPLFEHKISRSYKHKKKFNDVNFGPIMLTGPTGSGKSILVEKASKILNLDYIHINCANMVSEGIVGQCVQDIFKELFKLCECEIERTKHAIVFLDEFDKLLTNIHSESIIPQFLRAMEGSYVSITKSREEYQIFKDIDFIDTREMLFILGGSFEYILKEKQMSKSGFIEQPSTNMLKEEEIFSSFPREIAGRIKQKISLRSLDEEDFYDILTKSKKSPLITHKKIFSAFYNTDISFTESTLRKITKRASESPYGARILDRLVSELCDENKYYIDKHKHRSIKI